MTEKPEVPEITAPIKVVLAEDQSMVLGAFAALLDLQPDIDVVGKAENGNDALAAVRRYRPDILLTDIEMPGRTGLDVAAELQAMGDPTRVLIVTTFARSGYLRRALEAGVSGYVLKDSPIGDLVEALRQVHQGQRVIAPELAMAAWDSADPLTDRERQLLYEVADGASNADIAQRLHLAEGTVRNYLSTVLTKLGARNRTEAVRVARARGWL
jgi:two-component system response regulator DesR